MDGDHVAEDRVVDCVGVFCTKSIYEAVGGANKRRQMFIERLCTIIIFD